MAHQALATPSAKVSTPAIHVGPPNDGIKEMFDALEKRAFAIFQSSGLFGNDLGNWVQAEKELLHPTHVDISESGGHFDVRTEVPGFTAKDLKINLEGRRLTISGKREKHEERKDKKSVYSETCSNQLLRVVDLPGEVNAERARAELKDGILQLEIPKAAPAKKVPIEPKAA
jgi:HSP20 family protein